MTFLICCAARRHHAE